MADDTLNRTETLGSDEPVCKSAPAALPIGRRTAMLKVIAIKAGFSVALLAVAAVMLALLSAAAFGVPAGLMVSISGLAVKLFHAQFIVTSLSAEMMIFGGLAAVFGSAFCGLAAVRAGIGISGLFMRAKRKCDLLRGWKPF